MPLTPFPLQEIDFVEDKIYVEQEYRNETLVLRLSVVDNTWRGTILYREDIERTVIPVSFDRHRCC
jgi:hypothetical protein